MADFPQTGANEAPNGQGFATAANWAGALTSLVLLIGVGVWGYKLVMRDVSGIPVVRAAEGPMRIAPDDPGGRLADHQGLAVNDVAGTGTAAPPADRLMLAPEPTGLSDEDVAPGEIAEPAMDPSPERVELTALSEDADIDPIQALADRIAADAVPFSDVEPRPDLADTPEMDAALVAEAEAEEPAPEGALVRSLRPQVRPSGLRTASLAPLAPPQEGPREIDAETLAEGTRLVQLGAFDSPETARAEWDRLEARFGDYLVGKDRVIQRASSGGRVFYRLRAHGFADLSDARRFCAAFVAENADCIPVVTR